MLRTLTENALRNGVALTLEGINFPSKELNATVGDTGRNLAEKMVDDLERF